MKIRMMRLVEDTTVDGPGWRTSVYAAGCRHACPGCHNPETWPMTAGEAVEVDDLLARIAATEGNVTFSGGDPMYQAEAFAALAEGIVTRLHRTVWCYTGFVFEDVVADATMRLMLPWLEVLVDGPYIARMRDTNLLFRGSANQRLVDVQASLREGRAVLFDYDPYPRF